MLTFQLLAAQPLVPTSGFHAFDYAALVVYLGALVAMGFYFSRRERSTDDYFLAGRRIPWWAAGLSIFGTQLSAITFMAIPAKAYATDWVYFLNNMCIVLIAPVVVWLYLPFYRRLEITTAYEYLEMRFDVRVRVLGSVAFVLFQVGRMGVVLFLPAIALSAVTGVNVYVCILLMGVLATLYTVLGGIEAVIWTDVLQVFVLMGGALVALVMIVTDAGGTAPVLDTARAHDKFHMINWSGDYTTTALWVMVLGPLFGNLIPYSSDQTVVQRYLTTADEKQAARSIWTNAILAVPASILFFGVGTGLFVFYQQHPERLNPGLQTDAIFPWFIAQELPVGLAGIVIAGIFAAAMSSLDSSMNSVATVITTDFVRRFGAARSERQHLALARWVTVVLGVIGVGTALLMAAADVKSLWDVFLKVLGLLGGSMAGMFALGMLTRRANSFGALVGGVISAVILYAVQRFTSVHFFLWGAVGVMSCVVVGYLVSLVRPTPPQSLDGLTIHTLSAVCPEDRKTGGCSE